MSSEAASKDLNQEEVSPPDYDSDDAIYYDDYGEDFEYGPCMTHEQKMQKLEEFDKILEDKNYSSRTLEEAYPGVKITTRDELEKFVQYDSEKQVKNKENNELEKPPHDAGKQKGLDKVEN